MITHEARIVLPEHIHNVWDEIEQYVINAVAVSFGNLEVPEVKSKMLSGEYTTIVGLVPETNQVAGVLVVQLYNRINDRVAYVVVNGGRGTTNKPSFENFCNLLRSMGATCIEGHTSDAVFRLYQRIGFEKKFIASKFDLR